MIVGDDIISISAAFVTNAFSCERRWREATDE
jgi:hypothetical protein